VTDLDDHGERHARLVAEHGKPGQVRAALALELLGVRATVHPRDVVAYAYRDQAAADAFTASTAAHYGIPCLGTVVVDGAIVGAYDLRPVLEAGGVPLTSPHLPDDWTPPRPGTAFRLA
jgi:hypothetical protein